MTEAKVVLIDLQPRSVTLRKSQEAGFFEGSYSLNLSNSRGVGFAARIEIQADGDAKAEWISIPRERTLFDFPADKTAPIALTLRVPASAAGKKLSFTIRVMDTGMPDELYDKVVAEATVPAVETAPAKKLPPWLIPVIVVGVLVLAGGGFGIYKLVSGGTGLGKACDPDAPKCPDGIACHPTLKKCVVGVGQPCKKGGDCATSRCGDENKCALGEIGDACDPTDGLCAVKLECSKTTNACMGTQGVACEQGEQCLSGKCEAGKCGVLAVNDKCDPKRSFCGQGLLCVDAGKCLADAGRACHGDAECVTGHCAGGSCARSSKRPGEACGVGGDCGDPLLKCDLTAVACRGALNYQGCAKDKDCVTGRCANERCVYPEPGAACGPGCPDNQKCVTLSTSGPSGVVQQRQCLLKPEQECKAQSALFCSAFVCNALGHCAPDDGSCTQPTDCPSGTSCSGGRCMFTNGHACADSGVCLSTFCDGTCKPSPCGTCPALTACKIVGSMAMPPFGPLARCEPVPRTSFTASFIKAISAESSVTMVRPAAASPTLMLAPPH